MKKYSLTLLLVCLTIGLMAQSKTKRKTSNSKDQRWHELELNSVFLLQEILGSGDPEDLLQNYLVGYKMGKENVGLRVGLGAGFNRKNAKESLLDEQGTTDYHLRARIGIEWRKKLLERWSLISGLDMVGELQYIKDVTTSSFDEISTTDRVNAVGAGPLIGIRFWINPNISIATETGIHAFYIKRVEEVNSKNLPVFNTKKVTLEYPIRFDPPVNLYLIIRF